MVVPITSTFWPASKMSTLIWLPTSNSARGHAGLGVEPGQRLVDQRGALAASGDLQRTIAIDIRGAELGDAVGRRLDHRDRHRGTVIGKHARHAALAPDNTYRHFCYLVTRTDFS
jgi:hypothetical protein